MIDKKDYRPVIFFTLCVWRICVKFVKCTYHCIESHINTIYFVIQKFTLFIINLPLQ
jgi:hypothetical protein